MGIHDDEFVHPGTISDTLRCAVCMEVFEEPTFSGGWPCQHTFCKGCLDSALEQKLQCPTCREEVVLEYLEPNFSVRDLIDELKVYCGNKCGWTGRRDARNTHEKVCPIARVASARQTLEIRLGRRDELEAEKEAQEEELQAHDVDTRLREKDSKIKELEARADSQDSSLQDVVRRLEDRESRIAILEAQLREQDEKLEEMCLQLSLMDMDVPPRPSPPATPSRMSSRPTSALRIAGGCNGSGYMSPFASPSRPASARNAAISAPPKLESMPSLEEMIAGSAFDM